MLALSKEQAQQITAAMNALRRAETEWEHGKDPQLFVALIRSAAFDLGKAADELGAKAPTVKK